MPKCPQCGFDLPRENQRMGSAILDHFMLTIGGPDVLAAELAAHFKKSKKDPKKAGALYRLLMEMIQEEDKANVHQNYVEAVTELQERGFVMEYVLGNRAILEDVMATARMRGMLPQLIEAESERVS